jgi:hypothetical protein
MRARNRFFCFTEQQKTAGFQPKKTITGLRASQCAASARLTTRLQEKYLRMVDGIAFLAV